MGGVSGRSSLENCCNFGGTYKKMLTNKGRGSKNELVKISHDITVEPVFENVFLGGINILKASEIWNGIYIGLLYYCILGCFILKIPVCYSVILQNAL